MLKIIDRVKKTNFQAIPPNFPCLCCNWKEKTVMAWLEQYVWPSILSIWTELNQKHILMIKEAAFQREQLLSFGKEATAPITATTSVWLLSI